jgi:hypothetical protein
MSQIVTPPSIGMAEQSSKNWYRAEALRKVIADLSSIYNDVEDEPARRELKNALESIEEARMILNPKLRPPPKRVKVK